MPSDCLTHVLQATRISFVFSCISSMRSFTWISFLFFSFFPLIYKYILNFFIGFVQGWMYLARLWSANNQIEIRPCTRLPKPEEIPYRVYSNWFLVFCQENKCRIYFKQNRYSILQNWQRKAGATHANYPVSVGSGPAQTTKPALQKTSNIYNSIDSALTCILFA